MILYLIIYSLATWAIWRGLKPYVIYIFSLVFLVLSYVNLLGNDLGSSASFAEAYLLLSAVAFIYSLLRIKIRKLKGELLKT